MPYKDVTFMNTKIITLLSYILGKNGNIVVGEKQRSGRVSLPCEVAAEKGPLHKVQFQSIFQERKVGSVNTFLFSSWIAPDFNQGCTLMKDRRNGKKCWEALLSLLLSLQEERGSEKKRLCFLNRRGKFKQKEEVWRIQERKRERKTVKRND